MASPSSPGKKKQQKQNKTKTHFTPQKQTHQWDVPFGVPPTSEGPLHFVVPFIFH